MGPADGAFGLRALRPGLQHDPRRALRHVAPIVNRYQRRGQWLLSLRPRALRLRVCEQRTRIRHARAHPRRQRPRNISEIGGRLSIWLLWLRTGSKVIGIGSPRASLESNFAFAHAGWARALLRWRFRRRVRIVSTMLEILREWSQRAHPRCAKSNSRMRCSSWVRM